MSRDKGARFERDVAAAFRARGFACDRTPNSGGLKLKGDLYGNVPLHIEAKHQERWDVPAYIKQAQDEAEGRPWTVVLRKNRGDAFALMPLVVLLDLLEVAAP